jgi:hypothetical protein
MSYETSVLGGDDFIDESYPDPDWGGGLLWVGMYLNAQDWGLIYYLTPSQYAFAMTQVSYGDIPEAKPGAVRDTAGGRLIATANGLLVWQDPDFALFVKDYWGTVDEQDEDNPQQEDPTGGPDDEPVVVSDIIGMPPLAWASERNVREYDTYYGLRNQSFVYRVLEPFYGEEYWKNWDW